MTGTPLTWILIAFVAGWAGYGFSLYDVGTNSISLLLIAAGLLSLPAVKVRPRILMIAMAVGLSAGLSYAVAVRNAYGEGRPDSHLLQQLLGIGVLLGVSAIPWEQELPRLRKALLWVGAAVLAYAVYQFFARRLGWPWAFLEVTNLQYGSDGGLQRGFTRGGFWRVSSFFIEPSDLGRFMLWAFCFGLAEPGKTRRYLLIGGAGLGILLSQSLGAVLGALLLAGISLRHSRNILGLVFSVTLVIGLFLAAERLFPEEMAPFTRRIHLALALDESADSNRLQRLPHNLQVYRESPWLGHGLGTNHIVEQNGIAIGYLLLLIERGLFGTLLFLAPCVWAVWVLGWHGRRGDWHDNTAFLLLACELYCLATFAMIYFPPYWMAMGVTLRCAWFRRFGQGACVESRRPVQRVRLPRGRRVQLELSAALRSGGDS